MQIVNPNRCNGCMLCMEECQDSAIMVYSTDYDWQHKPMIDPERCNNCGDCADICPNQVFDFEDEEN